MCPRHGARDCPDGQFVRCDAATRVFLLRHDGHMILAGVVLSMRVVPPSSPSSQPVFGHPRCAPCIAERREARSQCNDQGDGKDDGANHDTLPSSARPGPIADSYDSRDIQRISPLPEARPAWDGEHFAGLELARTRAGLRCDLVGRLIGIPNRVHGHRHDGAEDASRDDTHRACRAPLSLSSPVGIFSARRELLPTPTPTPHRWCGHG